MLVDALGVAAVPLKLKLLLDAVELKPVPTMVREVPTEPLDGVMLVMVGASPVIPNALPALVALPTVTVTSPVFAPAGTVTVSEVVLADDGVADVPEPKVTELFEAVASKFVPVMVILAPTAADDALIELIVGDPVIPIATPELVCPPTVTVTGPVTAPLGTVTVSCVAVDAVTVPLVVPVPDVKATVLLEGVVL